MIDVTIDRLASLGLLPNAYRCIYVSGSLVRGWGNAQSDVDIYVIVDDPWRTETMHKSRVALDDETLPVEIAYVDKRRWDVEYWSASQVAAVLDKVAPDKLEQGTSAGKDLSDDELDFLDRLSFAELVDGADWLEAHQARLTASSLGSILTARSLNTADLYTEDAVGCMEAGDSISAVMAVKLAFGSTVDAVMASHGKYAQNPKWRARKVRETSAPELPFERYWQVETMADFDKDDPHQWVRDVLELCQTLSLEVAVV